MILNRKNYINKKNRRYKWTIKHYAQLHYHNYLITFPKTWSFLILLKNNYRLLYGYGTVYYFTFPIPKHILNIVYDKNSSTFNLNTIYVNTFNVPYWNYLTQIFNILHNPYFYKLKFKGKGYYIYKNKRNTITPQFGFAHRIYKYTFFVSVRFRTKTSILIFGLLLHDLHIARHSIKSMRPINIFTGRGVRFNRQVIYKKVGKVSSYR